MKMDLFLLIVYKRIVDYRQKRDAFGVGKEERDVCVGLGVVRFLPCVGVAAARKRGTFLSAFPMFVPSLSW